MKGGKDIGGWRDGGFLLISVHRIFDCNLDVEVNLKKGWHALRNSLGELDRVKYDKWYE